MRSYRGISCKDPPERVAVSTCIIMYAGLMFMTTRLRLLIIWTFFSSYADLLNMLQGIGTILTMGLFLYDTDAIHVSTCC